MATLSEIVEIRLWCWYLDRNARLETNLKQVPLVDSVETTHHSPVKPGIVSTSDSGSFPNRSFIYVTIDDLTNPVLLIDYGLTRNVAASTVQEP